MDEVLFEVEAIAAVAGYCQDRAAAGPVKEIEQRGKKRKEEEQLAMRAAKERPIINHEGRTER